MTRIAFALCLLSLNPIVRADGLPTGTWVERQPGHRTLTVEAAGAGTKLTYRGVVGMDGQALTVLTQFDGKDAPLMVDGNRSGQTMGIREIDSHHVVTVVKFQGKETGTSNTEI